MSEDVKVKVPRSLMDAIREEIDSEELAVDGSLPENLHGYVFLVAPIGNVDSNVITEDGIEVVDKIGNSFMNGNGMIYRFDFTNANQDGVLWTQKIAKTLDYNVDEIIHQKGAKDQNTEGGLEYYDLLKFSDYGLNRYSLLLGMRNHLNVAFLPIIFGDDEQEHLLVASDTGRPYEINTQSLEVIAPVGKLEEWETEFSEVKAPFPLNLSTSHLVFDYNNNEMFTVNYRRSISNFLDLTFFGIIRRIKTFLPFVLEPWRGKPEPSINSIKDSLIDRLILKLLASNCGILKWIYPIWESRGCFALNLISDLLTRASNIWKCLGDVWNWTQNKDFVDLIKWDGNKLEKRRLVSPCGKQIKIKHSMHEIGLTKNHVVLMDTSFGVGVEQLFAGYLETSSNGNLINFVLLSISGILRRLINTLIELLGGNTSFFRNFIRFTPYEDTTLYVVNRTDFKSSDERVVAHKVKIKGEIIHFAVDYQDGGKKITLHAGHNSAWDVAEWIRDVDCKGSDTKTSEDLIGMHLGPTDIGLMGRYVIDVSNGAKIVESKTKPHHICTWGLALYTFNNISSIVHPGKNDVKYEVNNVEQIKNIYWSSLGLWQEMTVDFMMKQYKQYPYRQISLDTVKKLAEAGIPSCLFCLDTESLNVEDYYEFPKEHIGGSIQFVPKKDYVGTEQNQGYIISVVFTPGEGEQAGESQIWIFDASALNKGPECKLRSDKLNIGMSLHMAWLPELCDRTSSYDVNDDYQTLVEQLLDSVDNFSFMTSGQQFDLKSEIQDLFTELGLDC